MKNIGKLFVEALLIIFSVLFALFINRMAENSKLEEKKAVAIEHITRELTNNQAILQSFKVKHGEILERISGIVDNPADSLRGEMLKKNYLDLGMLSNNQSLVDAFLTKTAWEAAKSTEILAEFDFELAQKLTHIYEMQDILMTRTMDKIIELYFDSETHDMRNFDSVMVQFQLRFQELIGQEYLMEDLYRKALEALNQEK